MDREAIVKLAYNLAGTGRFSSVVTLTNKLIRDGHINAWEALRGPEVSDDLERECRTHWRCPCPARRRARGSDAAQDSRG